MRRIARTCVSLSAGNTICCTSNKKQQVNLVSTIQYRANNPIQDRICYGRLKSINGFTASVFDGHGGHLVADFACQHLNQCLDEKIKNNITLGLSTHDMISKSLTEAYTDIQNSFMAIFVKNIKDRNYQTVGACALTAVILKNSIHIGNAGDCEGVLLGSGSPIKVNKRLNAGEPQEQTRLKKQFPNEADIYKCIKDTNYCYVKGRLQPTRSLGDYYLKHKQYNFTKLSVFTGPYIQYQPLITQFPIQQHKYLLLASDGLWDQLQETQMQSIAMKNLSNQETLPSKLLSAAFTKIKERNQMSLEELQRSQNRRDLHDDISIITIDLEKLKVSLNEIQ